MISSLRNILLLSCVLLASAQVPGRCPAPPKPPPNTRLDARFVGKQSFSRGEKVYYHCAEDSTPIKGLKSVQCVNGQWKPVTLKCEKKSCGYAGDILNGEVHYEQNSFIGSKVNVTCNEGYVLKGPSYLICKETGWTGPLPTCEESEVTCSPPAVNNAVDNNRGVSVFRVGESLTLACGPGFQLDGAQQVTCGPGGQWQPKPPQCKPVPTKALPPVTERQPSAGGCGVPHSRKNFVSLSDKHFGKTSFSSGEKVYYTCDVGYTPVAGSRIRTCKEGKWTPLKLECERSMCGSAGEITNGYFSYTGVEFGDTATAVCNEGYALVGQATMTCMSRGWDGRIPVCEAMTCEDPPEEANARIITFNQDGKYSYMEVVKYQCREGTLIGQSEIWCTEDGTWSAPPPTCQVKTCQPPVVHGASWARAQLKLYQPRDTLTIQCFPGYGRIGPETITCGPDGHWTPRLPRCIHRQNKGRRQHVG